MFLPWFVIPWHRCLGQEQHAGDPHGFFERDADDLGRVLQAGRMVPLLPEFRPVEFAINAIYPHRRHLSAKVRRFIDLLADRFAEHQRWMDPSTLEG